MPSQSPVRSAVSTALSLFLSIFDAQRQMREFSRLSRTPDSQLAARGVTRQSEIRRIMGLPQGA